MNLVRIFLATLVGAGAVALLGARPAYRAHPNCTAFMFRQPTGVVTGKNLDWPVGLGSVHLNSRGVSKTAWVGSADRPATWVSRFSSITLNQFGREFPLGGMNEVGLVVEELGFWPARYPPQDDRPAVNELEWIQYQLDRFASVAEVLAAEGEVRIAPFLFGLHYLVTDASGDAAVIEYLNGASVVHTGEDLPVAALANDTYANLVRQLRDHMGFGGLREPGSGHESPERFVRAATRIRQFESADLSAPVDSAFVLLGDVAQEDTQWSVVYDAGKGTVHYRTRMDHHVRSVRSSNDRADCRDGPAGFRIDGKNRRWETWSRSENQSLVHAVFAAMRGAGMEIPPTALRERMATHFTTVTCTDPPSRVSP
jgi:choloylglycine hydrolase